MAIGRCWCLLWALLLSVGICGAQTMYKSVDAQGRVTYSSHPPVDAVETEGVQIAPGPSAEAAEQARQRAKAREREADAQYRKLIEQRQKEAEARKEAESARLAKESAERQKRIDEALQRLEAEGSYVRPYPRDWPRPYPPLRPPYPVHPGHPVAPPNRPYEDHINPPTRNP